MTLKFKIFVSLLSLILFLLLSVLLDLILFGRIYLFEERQSFDSLELFFYSLVIDLILLIVSLIVISVNVNWKPTLNSKFIYNLIAIWNVVFAVAGLNMFIEEKLDVVSYLVFIPNFMFGVFMTLKYFNS